MENWIAADQRSRMLQQALVLVFHLDQAPGPLEAEQRDLRDEPDARAPVDLTLAERLDECAAIGVREDLLDRGNSADLLDPELGSPLEDIDRGKRQLPVILAIAADRNVEFLEGAIPGERLRKGRSFQPARLDRVPPQPQPAYAPEQTTRTTAHRDNRE